MDSEKFLNELRPNTLDSFEVLILSNLGPRTVRALNSHWNSLTELKLLSLGIEAIAELHLLTAPPALKVLTLQHSTVGVYEEAYSRSLNRVADWIRSCKALQRLELIRFMKDDALLLAKVLPEESLRLSSLSVEGCRTHDAILFHEILHHQSSLQYLYLEGHEINQPEHNGSLVRSISQLNSLRELELEHISDGFTTDHLKTLTPWPVTLPRRLKDVTRIRTMGALSPAPFNGFARGLGAAVHSGTLSMDAAVDFLEGMQRKPSSSWSETIGAMAVQFRGGDITLNQLYQLATHGIASLKPWNLALWGMIDQVRKGQCTSGEALGFLINSARGKQSPHRSGILVRGVGTRNGYPAITIRRTPVVREDSFMGESMATSIGASCAAFALMVLDLGAQKRPGVQCPEDWAKLETFIKSMERLGCPRDQVLESVEG